MAEVVRFPLENIEMRSCLDEDGTLRVSLEPVPVDAPADDEVVVRMEGAAVNPSDLGLMLGGVAADTFRPAGDGSLSAKAPPARIEALQTRVGQSLPVGLEGMGTVVAAGPAAQALLGKTVGLFGSGTYARYCKLPASACLVLPDGTPPEHGAGSFVNPITVLGMIDTMHREGHEAMIHTAAASNLGQMLVRICAADGIPLVNVVRSDEQVRLLKGIGAQFVCNSTAPDFDEALVDAIDRTGATIAFDAIGGGDLINRLLVAMEKVASAKQQPYSRYGSTVHKQVYIYGGLDPSPTLLRRDFGMAWSLGGWLTSHQLATIGVEGVEALKARIVRELTTTFASHFSRTLTLEEMLDPANLVAAGKRATGEKVLLKPNAGG